MRSPRRAGGELEGGFSQQTVGWIVGVALGSFFLAIVLSVFGEDLNGRPSAGPNSFSYSALGHRALAELLRGSGIGVVSRRSARGGRPDTQRPLVLAEPFTEGKPAATRMRALREEAAGRGASLVLVLPKWDSLPDPEHPGWIGLFRTIPLAEVEKVPGALSAPGLERVPMQRPGGRAVRDCKASWRAGARTFQLEIPHAQLFAQKPGQTPGALIPIVECTGGILVARFAPASGPEVFLIADPDFLNNRGLGRGGNAALAHDLFTGILHAKGVIFDETVHGLRRRAGVVAEALRFPLVLAVLQTLVLAGIVVWAGSGRFGKPLPSRGGPGDGKEVLIDNTALLLSHGGHAVESLARYYRQTLRTVGAACFLPPDLPEKELTDRLQRIAGRRGLHLDLNAFERRMERLAASGRPGDRAVRLARALHHWRREMLDGNRRHP
jgi:hypothetical protein